MSCTPIKLKIVLTSGCVTISKLKIVLKSLFGGKMKRFTEYYKSRSILEKWEQTGLLKLLKNPLDKEQCAMCLEGQSRYNEVSTSTNCIAAFKRISIPLVRRIYPNEVIQGSTKPLKQWYTFESIHLPVRNSVSGLDSIYDGAYNFDKEAENTAILAEMISKEIKEKFGKVQMYCLRFNEDDGTLEMNYDLI